MKLLTQEELVQYLRSAVEVQAADEDVEDTGYLAMSDDDLLLFIRVAMTRDYAKYKGLSKVPEDAVYPITLLARIQLYYKLATIAAPLYNLQADGASLSQTQRFEHYMSLINALQKEYEDYEENGGSSGTNGTLTSYNVQLANRYGTKYNYDTASPPAVILYVDKVGSDYVELSWLPELHTTDFSRYEIYISSKQEVFDEYDTENLVRDTSIKALTLKDIHKTKCRLKGLTPETTYFVGVLVKANGGKVNFDMESFTTIADDATEVEVEV